MDKTTTENSKLVGDELTIQTMSLKLLPVYSNKWCIVLQTDPIIVRTLLLQISKKLIIPNLPGIEPETTMCKVVYLCAKKTDKI